MYLVCFVIVKKPLGVGVGIGIEIQGSDKPTMQISYELEGALYLNLTNACPNRCVFCVRNSAPGVGGYNLWLDREPTLAEIMDSMDDPRRYREIVFCGYGEPTCRLDILTAVAREMRKYDPPKRLNTNGLGNLINGRNILPDLAGLLDTVSISLNAPNAAEYSRLCRPRFGEAAYPAVLDFIREAKKYLPCVVVSIVPVPGVDVEACRKLAAEMDVAFRVRHIISEADS